MLAKLAPPVASVLDPTGPRTIATEISALDLRLGEMIREVAAANGYDSPETIAVLERHGLKTATQFVRPLMLILQRPSESPLRKLTAFEIEALFCANDRQQQEVLTLLEEEFDAGPTPEITTGIVTRLLAKGRARRAAAKVREGRPVTRSRDDYALEAAQLRERVQRLEHHIESLAQAADNEEVKALILEVLQ